MLERWRDSEWRIKMSEVTKKLWNNPEYRRMMSEKIRERWQDPEWREFFSAFMMEKWQDPEYRQTMLGFLQSPERREQHGKMMRDLWQDPEFIDKVNLDYLVKIRTGYRTDIEAITEQALQELNLNYEFEHRVGRYSIDFFLPDYEIAVECDGEYWHRDRVEKDAARDKYLIGCGLTVVHLYGPDIREDVNKLLVEKLLPVIEEKNAT